MDRTQSSGAILVLIPSDSVPHAALAYIDGPLKFLFVGLACSLLSPRYYNERSVFFLSPYLFAGCFKAYARRIDGENDHHTCSIGDFGCF